MSSAENSAGGVRSASRPVVPAAIGPSPAGSGAEAPSESTGSPSAIDDGARHQGVGGRSRSGALDRGVGGRAGVELQIGELVVHGYSESGRERIAASLERELGRLLREQDPDGLKGSADSIELDGGKFDVRPGSTPEEAGIQIARAIVRGLKR